MIRSSIACLLLAGVAVSIRAADPDPKSLAVPPAEAARATGLVAALASRDYAERDEATKELRKLGRLAYPALRDALRTNSNAEVRFRIEMVFPAATDAELDARIECLLADTDGKYEHDLPGAKAFFAATGRTPAARQLLAAMLRSENRAMLLAVDDPEPDRRRQFDERRIDLGVLNVPGRSATTAAMTDTDVAAVLFADSFLPDTGTAAGGFGGQPTRGARFGPSVSYSPFLNTLTSALADETRREALGGVVRRWMETREHPQSVYYAVNAMHRHGLPDALPAARKLVAGKLTGGPISYIAQAVTYVARFGTADDLPLLEKLFAEKVTVTVGVPNGPISRRYTIQMRDVALAMVVLLSGQEPADYGLEYRYVRGISDSQKHNPMAYYFETEDEEKADAMRDAAFKKYAEWKEAKKAKR